MTMAINLLDTSCWQGLVYRFLISVSWLWRFKFIKWAWRILNHPFRPVSKIHEQAKPVCRFQQYLRKTNYNFSLALLLIFKCFIWVIFSLTQIIQHRIQMSENRVQGKIFEPKREKLGGGWRILLMSSFIICTLRHVLSSVTKSRSVKWEACLSV